MPGSRLRLGYAGPLARLADEALAKAASPGMTTAYVSALRHTLAFPRRIASGLNQENRAALTRGRGECRAANAHPQPRVRMKKAHELVHHEHAGAPGIPAREWF